jgi:hypothetical protein
VAARKAEREAAGWKRVSLWLPPSVSADQVRTYINRAGNRAEKGNGK